MEGCIQCESLSFTLAVEESKLVCRESRTRLRVPLTVGEVKCLQDCWARFIPRVGLELRPRLLGGGCCQSAMPVPHSAALHDLRDLHAAKKVSIVQNQRLAQEIAEETRDLAYRGLTSGLRLTQLDDLPQVSINSPLPVAEALLEALQEEGLWMVESDFLMRQTVARLARRHFVDHLFAERTHFVENVRERLREPVKKLRKRAKASHWHDAGVLTEMAALQLFASSVHDTSRVWQQVRQPKPVVGRALVLPRPEEDLPTLEQIRTVLCHSMETQLLIDDLYFQALPQNMDALLEIACLLLEPGSGKSWKTFYQALSFLEWCFHRELISPVQAHFLEPHLAPFLTLETCSALTTSSNAWRICEKLATLLIKASQQRMLTDLLQAMSIGEPDKRIQMVLTLPVRMLRLEPPQAHSRNFQVSHCIGRDSEVQKARAMLSSEHFLSVAGLRGVGKTHLAKALAEPYEVAWLCCGVSVPSLRAGLHCLACNLRVSFEGLYEALAHRRVLLILDEANSASLQTCRELVPTCCHLVTTSPDPLSEPCLDLQPLDFPAATTFLGDQSARTLVLAKALPGLPLALRVGKSLGESAAEVVLQLASVELIEDKQKVVVETWVRALAVKSESAWLLLQVLSLLSPQEAIEELYEPIFRRLRPNDSLSQAKADLHPVIDEDAQGAFSLPTVLQGAVSIVAVLERTVSLAQHLFSDECLADTNLRLAVSVERLVSMVERKDTVEAMELRLCLKWAYFCVEKLGCGQHVSDLLEKACVWYRHNSRGLDFQDLPVPYYLGTCFRRIGNLSRAAELLFLEVVVCEKTLPQTHPDMAFAYELLASVNYELRNLGVAETFQQKCVQIRDTLGASAGSYSLLASIFHDQGKLKEAEKTQLRAVEVASESELSAIYNNLACIYQDLADLPSALRYQEIALKLDEAHLQANHSNLAISYANLSNILRDMGDLQRAQQLQQKALHIKEEVLPSNHPLLGVSYHSMARIQLALASPTSAHDLQTKALRIEEQAADPQRLARYLHTMSEIETALGNSSAAKALLEREVTLRLEKLPEDSKSLATAFYEIGRLAMSDTNFEAARNYLEQTLTLREKIFPLQHPEVRACCQDLSQTCRALQLTTRALELETRLTAS